MNYERANFFDRSDFPESWRHDDFEFLAEFCREEFGAELVEVLDDPDGYDLHLFLMAEGQTDA